ncbi:AAA family ATPase [Piscinibacter sakaiensis]|uniref:AAA family ATPase n=1 Tax=Piscinibacter sakaiensis TaxID=1547922 RepID=UPI003AAF16B2
MPITLAAYHEIYKTANVERALGQLPEDSRALARLYEKMIERGGERFVSKPSAVPDVSEWRAQSPNFGDVIDEVLREIALVVDTDDPLELTPILLVGDPGVGKTRFARGLAAILGTGNATISLAQTTAGWVVGGSAATWQGAKPGKVFETLLHGETSNPVVTIDEIDKASSGQYDPLGAFYALLERDTAAEFVDEYVDLPVDASRILWIATANDTRSVPEPILSRMRVIEVRPPTREEARVIAAAMYREQRAAHRWGDFFAAEPADAVLDALEGVSPRELGHLLRSAFGAAKMAGRSELTVDDLGTQKQRRPRMGF